MTTKKTKKTTPETATPTAEDLAQQAKSRAATERASARVATDGTVTAALVMQYLPSLKDSTSATALAEVLREQGKAIAAGDLSQLEAMLLAEATALHAMFIDLASRARQQDRIDALQTLTTLSLKAVAGARQSIVALAELRMPKSVMFAKQANVTNGPQQVNNGVVAQASPARAEEFQNPPNELLEKQHGNWLDTRTGGASGGADPHVEVPAPGHRANHR